MIEKGIYIPLEDMRSRALMHLTSRNHTNIEILKQAQGFTSLMYEAAIHT